MRIFGTNSESTNLLQFLLRYLKLNLNVNRKKIESECPTNWSKFRMGVSPSEGEDNFLEPAIQRRCR